MGQTLATQPRAVNQQERLVGRAACRRTRGRRRSAAVVCVRGVRDAHRRSLGLGFGCLRPQSEVGSPLNFTTRPESNTTQLHEHDLGRQLQSRPLVAPALTATKPPRDRSNLVQFVSSTALPASLRIRSLPRAPRIIVNKKLTRPFELVKSVDPLLSKCLTPRKGVGSPSIGWSICGWALSLRPNRFRLRTSFGLETARLQLSPRESEIVPKKIVSAPEAAAIFRQVNARLRPRRRMTAPRDIQLTGKHRPSAALSAAPSDRRGVRARRVRRRRRQRARPTHRCQSFGVERPVAARARKRNRGDVAGGVERETHRRHAGRAARPRRLGIAQDAPDPGEQRVAIGGDIDAARQRRPGGLRRGGGARRRSGAEGGARRSGRRLWPARHLRFRRRSRRLSGGRCCRGDRPRFDRNDVRRRRNGPRRRARRRVARRSQQERVAARCRSPAREWTAPRRSAQRRGPLARRLTPL